MERFGEKLKRARESKGLRLEFVAARTRISRRYLDALENSDLDTLPGGAFDTGYIRAYAEVLGADPAPFLAAYERERERLGRGKEQAEAQLLDDLARLARNEAGTWSAAINVNALRAGAVLLAVSILGGAAWWISTDSRDRARQHAAPATTASERRAAPAPATTPAPSRPIAAESESENETEVSSEPTSESAIAVPDSGVGRNIVEHNLVGAGQRFAEGSTVVFWTRVVGARPGAVIRHVWRHQGQTVMRSNLTVGGPHWRTYSRLVLPEGSSGGWEVEARDPEGKLLAREQFVCLESPPETTDGTAGDFEP